MSEIAGTTRTVDEAHLYMDLHPCSCGSARFTRDSSLIDVDGDLVSRYTGECAECGTPREFRFRLIEVPTIAQRGPQYFGDERSDLLDAGQWLFIADRYAAAVPALPPDDPDEVQAAARRIGIALEAMEQVLQFVDPDSQDIAPAALQSAQAQDILNDQPGRFRPSRLAAVRESYRATTAEYQRALAGGVLDSDD